MLPDAIPWNQIRGIRNRLVHQYFDIDSQILWLVISIEIPNLKVLLQEFLDVYNAQGGYLFTSSGVTIDFLV